MVFSSDAVKAVEMNAKLNSTSVNVTTEDFVGSSAENFDMVLLGDMFYDSEFSLKLASWISLLNTSSKTVLLGDPSRYAFQDAKKVLSDLTLVKTYSLPESVRKENNGLTEASVWGCNLD